MFNIIISHKIRGINPNLGDIPKTHIYLDLSDRLTNKVSHIKNIYEVLQVFLDLYKINKNEIFNLYMLAPNSICVTVPFILTSLGYQYICINKIFDCTHWGNLSYPSAIFRVLAMERSTIFNDKKELYITFQGSEPINDKLTVLWDMRHYEIKVFPNNFDFLENEQSFARFLMECEKLFLEIIKNRDVSMIHIISSIPAIGLMTLGRVFSNSQFNEINFRLYNFYNKQYLEGGIISHRLLELSINQKIPERNQGTLISPF